MPHPVSAAPQPLGRPPEPVEIVTWSRIPCHHAGMSSTERLEQASVEYADATKRAQEARARLMDAIVRAARDGVRQIQIVRATGYTREAIRRICANAGLTEDPNRS